MGACVRHPRGRCGETAWTGDGQPSTHARHCAAGRYAASNLDNQRCM